MISGGPFLSRPFVLLLTLSETGRIRFQTQSSVSFLALAELQGGSSVSSSQPIIRVPKRTHWVFRRTHWVCHWTQWVFSSERVLSKQYSARFQLRILVLQIGGAFLRIIVPPPNPKSAHCTFWTQDVPIRVNHFLGSADRKRGQQKGATSKKIKKCQK